MRVFRSGSVPPLTRTRSVWGVALCGVALLVLGLLTVGVAAAGVAPPGVAAGASCTRTIRSVADARAALPAAVPGDMLCFLGADLADVDLTMTRSGTTDAPITLVSDGHTIVHQFHILADHVVIQGFTISGGGELLLAGTGIVAQKNTVRDTQRGGIVCASCIDSAVQSNTVTHVATTGIFISGQRITVRENLVDGDADGVRFFGNGHRIISNVIEGISGARSAHPDCFQTFDAGHPATFDVEIVGNVCRSAGENCLIATGDESGNSIKGGGAAPAGSRSITFLGNTCATNGAQAVSLRHWPGVEVRKNKLLGPNLKRGILITRGSTGCIVQDNTLAKGVPAVEIDDSSRR